jgi:hypothetical protein
VCRVHNSKCHPRNGRFHKKAFLRYKFNLIDFEVSGAWVRADVSKGIFLTSLWHSHTQDFLRTPFVEGIKQLCFLLTYLGSDFFLILSFCRFNKDEVKT